MDALAAMEPIETPEQLAEADAQSWGGLLNMVDAMIEGALIAHGLIPEPEDED